MSSGHPVPREFDPAADPVLPLDLFAELAKPRRHPASRFSDLAGVSLFYLARIMGTSVAQIDATYGHLLPESEDYLRGLLDA